ncbi:MAG TPA: biopolymer transporter ExbD, partial [Pseudomonadales bacterium]|nr:biopolymer transporter ExbD [Pseudomonadales bacterium]
MRLKRRVHADHESSTGIDLAPMLDFVINLLIFFIVTAVFVKATAVVVNRPTSFEQTTENDSKSIQIQVLENGEVWVDNRSIDVRAVRANVERMSAVNADAGVLILANEMAPMDVVVAVVDELGALGLPAHLDEGALGHLVDPDPSVLVLADDQVEHLGGVGAEEAGDVDLLGVRRWLGQGREVDAGELGEE